MKPTRQRDHGTMEYWPQTPEERVSAFKSVVADKAYAKIDGTMIDLFSANVVVQVYDAISDENKSKFSNFPAGKMALLAFKLTK